MSDGRPTMIAREVARRWGRYWRPAPGPEDWRESDSLDLHECERSERWHSGNDVQAALLLAEKEAPDLMGVDELTYSVAAKAKGPEKKPEATRTGSGRDLAARRDLAEQRIAEARAQLAAEYESRAMTMAERRADELKQTKREAIRELIRETNAAWDKTRSDDEARLLELQIIGLRAALAHA